MVSVQEKYGIPRLRVTGAMLQRFVNKNVRLIGRIVKNGRDTIEVNTGDAISVIVRFQSPVDEALEGIIDVQGRVTSKNVVEVDSYIIFPPELASSFDLKTHYDAITFIETTDNPWTQAVN